MDAIAFNWGLSSKAPKPPLDRFHGRCKPLIEAAYLTRRNVCFASLSFVLFGFFFRRNPLDEIIGFQAINC
jgi:hypothetical protein